MSEQPAPPPPPSSTGTGGQPPVETPPATGTSNPIKRAIETLPASGSPVGAGGILLVATFLIVLTLFLLYSITRYWPVCDTDDLLSTTSAGNTNASNANAAVVTNTNANRSAPANSNANAAAAAPGANSNATTNTAANANTGANANANTNANANAAARVPARSANVRAPSPVASPASTDNTNTAKRVVPTLEPNSGPITGKTLVTIKGENFGSTTEGVVVKFGEREAQVKQVKDNIISVSTPGHSEGLVDVTIERGKEATVLAAAYTYTCPAPSGRSLFIMLILAGGLGGCIHALRSFYWYVGQGDLRWRWMPMYFSLPFVGAAMAMIFSLLIIAGFVDNTTGKSTALFIIAAAGLVGMFSQQAALKLTDIANAFFTKPGEGKNSQPQESLPVSERGTKSTPIVTAMDKTTGKAAGGDIVKITGSGFNTSTTVNFGGNSARVTTFDATSITVVTPPGTGKVNVEVSSGGPPVKLPVKFEYIP